MNNPISPAAKRARDRAAAEVMKRIQDDRARASKQIARMLVYIEDHLYDPINVESLRRACGITDNSTSIRFHQEMGRPPKSYISARRLEIASRLLWETNLKIWQIGVGIGYSSIGVFSKAFHAWSGQRPTAFRRRRQGVSALRESPNPDLGRRALAGDLDTGEARRVFHMLHQLYPEAVEGCHV